MPDVIFHAKSSTNCINCVPHDLRSQKRAEGNIICFLDRSGGYNALNGFTEDTGERNRPVICRVCFISFLMR